MSRSRSYLAIVLRTHDVGEADRFCILFTRERGRLSVRVAGARKLTSRMGGSLLPLRCIRVQLKEWSNGFMAESAELSELDAFRPTVEWFTQAQQGIEVLLGLTQDEEPLPEVFDATARFLRCCGDPQKPIALAYTIELLSLLGLLPETQELQAAFLLTDDELLFLHAARHGEVPEQLPRSFSRIQAVCQTFLADQLSGPLRAPQVAAEMQESKTARLQRTTPEPKSFSS